MSLRPRRRGYHHRQAQGKALLASKQKTARRRSFCSVVVMPIRLRVEQYLFADRRGSQQLQSPGSSLPTWRTRGRQKKR
jgi:hypothetical protein